MLHKHAELEAAFHPNTIAVIGASDNPISLGYRFVYWLMSHGYTGNIYAVNPKKKVILGLPVYPNLSSIPEPVDYVICCISAFKIPALLEECPGRGTKFVHIFSGRLSETGRKEAKELEAVILRKARKLNLHLIGPNCMGIYHPRHGITFNEELPMEIGEVGALFQSGGLATLLIRYGVLQGLGFSKVISYGNALDLDECDFLEYLTYDEKTGIIACYIEGTKDGKRFIKTLFNSASIKPVIIIKGGRGIAGKKSAASHTAALSGSYRIWQTALRQTGAIQVGDLSELVDLLVLFSFLPSINGKRAGILGGGGGPSVLTADICEAAGIMIPQFSYEMKEELKKRAPEIWDWLGNPVDISASWPFIQPEEILKMMAESPYFDFIIANIDEPAALPKDEWNAFIGNIIDTAINISKRQVKPIIVVLSGGKFHLEQFQDWRWRSLADFRSRLVAAHVPTYSTITEAVKAISKFIDYWQKRK